MGRISKAQRQADLELSKLDIETQKDIYYRRKPEYWEPNICSYDELVNPVDYVTRENLYEYNGGRSPVGSYGPYMTATMHMIDKLDGILGKAKNFKQLKKELTSLINDRKQLVEHSVANSPDFGEERSFQPR